MELFRVSVEVHWSAATVYVAGFLAPQAAARVSDATRALPSSARVLRVDLRAVVLIDPEAFACVAQALSRWRDEHHAQVLIQFPERSHDAPARPQLVHPSQTIGSAVSTATSWPMSTSPG